MEASTRELKGVDFIKIIPLPGRFGHGSLRGHFLRRRLRCDWAAFSISVACHYLARTGRPFSISPSVLNQLGVLGIAKQFMRLFHIVEFVVEFCVAVSPLGLAPAFAPDGLAVVATAHRQRECRVAPLRRGIF